MGTHAVVLTNFKAIGGRGRGLVRINEKPIMEYVLESVPDEVDNIIITVRDDKEAESYSEIAEKYLASVHVSTSSSMASDLAHLMEETGGGSFLVLPCDAPLLKIEFTSFLLEACKKFSAAIPRMSANTCYYMFSSYRSKEFLEAYSKASSQEMAGIVSKMNNVLFVNLNALRIFDEKLYMLLRVTTMEDARRVERIMKSRLRSS